MANGFCWFIDVCFSHYFPAVKILNEHEKFIKTEREKSGVVGRHFALSNSYIFRSHFVFFFVQHFHSIVHIVCHDASFF